MTSNSGVSGETYHCCADCDDKDYRNVKDMKTPHVERWKISLIEDFIKLQSSQGPSKIWQQCVWHREYTFSYLISVQRSSQQRIGNQMPCVQLAEYNEVSFLYIHLWGYLSTTVLWFYVFVLTGIVLAAISKQVTLCVCVFLKKKNNLLWLMI